VDVGDDHDLVGAGVLEERVEPGVFPSPEEAEAYPWTPREIATAEAATSSHIVGSPATVRAGFDAKNKKIKQRREKK